MATKFLFLIIKIYSVNNPHRRDFLRFGMAATGGGIALLSGCSMGRNRVNIEVQNEDTQLHRVEITAVSSEEETLFEKNPQIEPGEDAFYDDVLPTFDTEAPYHVTASLEDGTSATVTPEMSVVTEVWFEIRSSNELVGSTTVP